MTGDARASGETIDRLLEAMLALSHAVELELESRPVKAAGLQALSVAKSRLLCLLGHHRVHNASETARRLGVTKSAVSQIVASMVHDKLVSRKTGTRDRREVDLRLTKRGQECFQAVRRRQRQRIREALVRLPAGSTGQCAEMLRTAAAALAPTDQPSDRLVGRCDD